MYVVISVVIVVVFNVVVFFFGVMTGVYITLFTDIQGTFVVFRIEICVRRVVDWKWIKNNIIATQTTTTESTPHLYQLLTPSSVPPATTMTSDDYNDETDCQQQHDS